MMKQFGKRFFAAALALTLLLPLPGRAVDALLEVKPSITIKQGETLYLIDEDCVSNAKTYLDKGWHIMFSLKTKADGITTSYADDEAELYAAPDAAGTAILLVELSNSDDVVLAEKTIEVTVVDQSERPVLSPVQEEPLPEEEKPVGGTNEEETPSKVEPPVPPVEQPTQQGQSALVLQAPVSATYGDTIQLSATGGSGTGTVTYELLTFTGAAKAELSSTGRLTFLQAGKVRVRAEKAEDAQYLSRRSDAIDIEVRPASITITAPDLSAMTGGEVPALTGNCQVAGLVGGDKLAVQPTLSYQTAPDMTKAGTVTILASGAEVPAGGNYDPNITYVPGTLTIQEVPAYTITALPVENGVLSVYQTSAEAGSEITFTAQPQEGYVLESVTVRTEGGTSLTTTQGEEGVYHFSMPESDVTISASFLPEELPPEEVPLVMPFIDVLPGDWFYENVAYVYAEGLMNGTSDTTFTPNGTTTRGMIVTILYRMADSPEAPAWSPFGDVPPEQYYAGPVAWAAWHGIVNGKTSDSFAPDEPITREQMAAIFYRYAQIQGQSVTAFGNLTQFLDQGQISDYARPALAWANGAGIINGKGGGLLDPQGPATRAEAAAILQRFCALVNP